MGKKTDMKADGKLKIRKSFILRFFWVIIVLLSFVLILFTVHLYDTLTVQLFNERRNNLTEITVKVSEVLDAAVSSVQSKANSAQRLIESYSFEDSAQIFAAAQDAAYNIDLERGSVIIFDNRGRFYGSDGYTGRWDNQDDLTQEEFVPVIREFSMNGTDKDIYMVFMRKIAGEKQVGGSSSYITHTAVVIPLSDMKETLSVTAYGDDCFSYLISSNGRRLYKQTFSKTFIEDFNVLSALSDMEFLMGDTAEELSAAVKNREQCCMEFAAKNLEYENYFVATVPMSDTDWTVLLFVPAAVISNSTTGLLGATLTYFGGITFVLLAMIATVIYAFVTIKSDKKQMAQQEETNHLLKAAADTANSANAAKSEFLSHMSHDIRTPINGIIGMTNIAMKNIRSPERIEDCLRKIGGAADHLLMLINDVLDMSRIESGKTQIENKPIDIRTIIDNCTSIISGQTAVRSLNFKTDFEDFRHPKLFGDSLHLRQILINILGNAIKFTPEDGTVSFSVKELGAQDGRALYRFEIEDTGIGMSEEFVDKIFDSFSQEIQGDDASRTNYIGTGLGMAITKKLVDLMGGTIQVRSEQGRGSCFTVEIGFDIDENVDRAQIPRVKKQPDVAGMKVLLVEDNELNMEIAVELLSAEGIHVTCANNGREGCDAVLNSPPGTFDAVLMDIMMPVMNGYEATAAIRSSDRPDAANIPIIAMTANAYAEDIRHALSVGMNDHVAKPIDLDRLLCALSKYNPSRKNVNGKDE